MPSASVTVDTAPNTSPADPAASRSTCVKVVLQIGERETACTNPLRLRTCFAIRSTSTAGAAQ